MIFSKILNAMEKILYKLFKRVVAAGYVQLQRTVFEGHGSEYFRTLENVK